MVSVCARSLAAWFTERKHAMKKVAYIPGP